MPVRGRPAPITWNLVPGLGIEGCCPILAVELRNIWKGEGRVVFEGLEADRCEEMVSTENSHETQ